ncbi:unnamed protein product [Cylindrotheca closterium]|uniref:RAP domain-containing protein n=1 Tax=Cylindrotheca closterium TaxID=2856 RepID=A0AAD2PU65_9STRA|nr:unnamed protein product [Cylindrotheca closterium]
MLLLLVVLTAVLSNHFAAALLPSQTSNPSSSPSSSSSILHSSPSNTNSLQRRRQPYPHNNQNNNNNNKWELFVAAASEPRTNEDTSSSASSSTAPSKTKKIPPPKAKTTNNNNNNNGNKKNNINHNNNSNNNNNNKKRVNYSNVRNKPWQADFKTSIRTQGKIKKAYSTRYKTRTLKAKEILKALLTTHPTQVNAANVICALTYSAKSLGTSQISTDLQLRSMLFQAFDILSKMVHKGLLNTRQLCNACWAIAKHYDRDHELLPKAPEAVALSDEGAIGTAVQINILDEPSPLEQSQILLEDTLDDIARQLTDILNGELEGHYEAWQKPAQVGEICMASWAYGKLRHRKKPPGWQDPPQTGRLANRNNNNHNNNNHNHNPNADVITFESWTSIGGTSTSFDGGSTSSSTSGGPVSTFIDNDVTNALFDAFAAALCDPSMSKLILPDESQTEPQHSEVSRLKDCSWSELANLGWSFAAHGSCKSEQSQTLLQKLAQETSRRLHFGGSLTEHLLTRDLAQLIWALGTTQADNYRLADDLVILVEDLSNEYLKLNSPRASFSRAARPLKTWSCPDLVQVTLGMAHSRIDEQPLLQAIYKENNHRLVECEVEDASVPHHHRKCFHPWEVSVLLWAQARLYLKEEQGEDFEDFVANAPGYILSAIAKGQSLQSVGIGPQEQANIVWSLTVLEEHQSSTAIKLIQKIFQEAAESLEENQSIQLEHAHQLWQAYFIMEEESPEAVSNVPTWFSKYLEKKWTLEKAKLKISSARHRSISQCLQLMGVDHRNEHDEDIDVAIVVKQNALWTHETQAEGQSEDDLSLAVEFDGPNHFAREKTDEDGRMLAQPRALGHSVLKYRLLKKQGWTVVRIPYFEFDKIPFWASMERQRYLQRKLKTHGNLKFSESDVSEYSAMSPNRKSRFD